MKQHRQRVVSFIHERWPEVAIADPGEQVAGFYRMESNTALDRPLPHWQYSSSDNTKWITSSFPNLVSSNTTVDFIDFPYRHVAISPHQQALRLVQALANGGALDYYLIERLDNHLDRSGFEEIFHYHAAHEDTYANLRSQAGIALVKEGSGWSATDEYRGWFRALVENHFLFDAPGLEVFTHLDWSKYRAIILPGVKAISAELATRNTLSSPGIPQHLQLYGRPAGGGSRVDPGRWEPATGGGGARFSREKTARTASSTWSTPAIISATVSMNRCPSTMWS